MTVFFYFFDEIFCEISQNVSSEKDKKYKVSFFVSLAENSDFAIKNIDYLLSASELNTSIFREMSERQLKKNNVSNFKIYTIENNRYYDNKSNWTMIWSEFTAQGDEKYLTIGNFLKNSKTEKLLVSNKNRNKNSFHACFVLSSREHSSRTYELQVDESSVRKALVESFSTLQSSSNLRSYIVR